MPITATLVLLLIGIFFYQSSANAIWVYLERIGSAAGLDADAVSQAVAIGTAIGIPGALVAVVAGNRFGRWRILLSGLAMTIAGVVLLLDTATLPLFLTASCLIGFGWSYVLAYLFGATADVHSSGQGATAGGVASKLGLATGPLIAAGLVSDSGFTAVVGASIAGLVACLVVTFRPIRALDRRPAQPTSRESAAADRPEPATRPAD